MTYLLFVDAGDDAACYHKDRLISMTCASNATLLLNFESSGSGSTAAWSHGHDIITLTITADAERAVMARIILEMTDSSGADDMNFIVVADDIERAATGTITITDFTNLNSGDKVNLQATDGTAYDFVQGDQSSVSGTFEATTSNNVTATNLMNVINTSSGPAGTRFTATVSGAVVTATQATVGANGNTPVNLTGAPSVSVAATAALACADGDDNTTNQFTEGEYVKMTSTDGTLRVYVLVDGSESGAPATGTIIASGADTGVGTLSSVTAALGTCVAVQNNLDTHQQAVVLNEFKAAIVHANGHNGKITASADVAVTDGAKTITLTQATDGALGNRTPAVTTNPEITCANFSGGTDGGVSGTVGMSATNFSSGKNKEYVDSRITACSIALDT